MSCVFCKDHNTNLMPHIEYIPSAVFGWCESSTFTGAEVIEHEANLSVFIDRGYLRVCDSDESQCMDHGNKVKIKFCPMCGHSFDSEEP